ncbi:MAG TPA: hypothetical protein VF068_01465 [Rubrobacter sp.]
MATAIWCILVVVVAVALAVVGLILVQRLVPFSVRESHNATTATMFGALYVVYGLMVGFSAFLVAGQFDTAQKTAESEAGSVEEIYHLAERLPEPERQKIQGLAESYARTVVKDGWPMMARGRSSERAAEIADNLRRGVLDLDPKSGVEQEVYAQGLTLIQDLDEYRALRLLEVREGIPKMLWAVLLVGALITTGCTYLFGMKTPGLHLVMVVAFTIVLALVLFTIRALEYPFDGIVQVGPDAFEEFLDKIKANS